MVGAAPAKAAKEKKKPAKQADRTWKTLIDYVLKNGDDDIVKPPTSRTLGYDADNVETKTLGIEDSKSKDGQEHNLDVVYGKDADGALKPKELILAVIRVKASGDSKEINSYRIRATLDGAPIRGMHATGLVENIVQQPLTNDSEELRKIFKQESVLYLRNISLTELTK